MIKETLKGAMIASAVAALFVGSAYAAEKGKSEKKTAKVECKQSNDCKGKGGCGGADNACKGKNSCQGHSFNAKSKEDCEKAGGTVAAK